MISSMAGNDLIQLPEHRRYAHVCHGVASTEPTILSLNRKSKPGLAYKKDDGYGATVGDDSHANSIKVHRKMIGNSIDRLGEDKVLYSLQKAAHAYTQLHYYYYPHLNLQAYLHRLASNSLTGSSLKKSSSSSAKPRRLVNALVSRAAGEALDFLRARDEFWEQVELGVRVQAPITSQRLNLLALPRST